MLGRLFRHRKVPTTARYAPPFTGFDEGGPRAGFA